MQGMITLSYSECSVAPHCRFRAKSGVQKSVLILRPGHLPMPVRPALAAEPHWDLFGMEKAFQFSKFLYHVMKDGGGQGCIGMPLFEHVQEVRRAVCPARGDQRHSDALR